MLDISMILLTVVSFCIIKLELTSLVFFYLGSFAAIIIIMNLFSKYEKKMPSFISKIGSRTLDIYVLHYFFVPKEIEWFSIYLMKNQTSYNLSIEICITVIIAILTLLITYTFSYFIRESSIMSFVILGKITSTPK